MAWLLCVIKRYGTIMQAAGFAPFLAPAVPPFQFLSCFGFVSQVFSNEPRQTKLWRARQPTNGDK